MKNFPWPLFRWSVSHQIVAGLLGLMVPCVPLLAQTTDEYFKRGLDQKVSGNLEGTAADIDKVITLNPNSAEAYNNHGNVKSAKANFDGAIGDSTQTIELNPTFRYAYYYRGKARLSRGNLDGAIADFDRTIALNPDLDVAFAHRSGASLLMGQLTSDRDASRGFIATDGDRPRSTDDFPAGDYLIPRKGKSIMTLATGIPYLGITEVAYGFTSRFSAGVIAGVLGNLAPGYGLRFRYVLAQPSRDLRIYFKAPVIYYPKAKTFGCPDCDPWFLTWPTVNAKWRLVSEIRLWSGVGVVAAACATTVLGGHKDKEQMAEGLHQGVWNTLQIGCSRPISRRISFQFEAAAVLKGLKLASSRNWVGGVPVILTTGFSYMF